MNQAASSMNHAACLGRGADGKPAKAVRELLHGPCSRQEPGTIEGGQRGSARSSSFNASGRPLVAGSSSGAGNPRPGQKAFRLPSFRCHCPPPQHRWRVLPPGCHPGRVAHAEEHAAFFIPATDP